MKIAERFGMNLRAQRVLAGLTQEDLAFRADIHRTEVSLLETGGRVPRVDTVVKLAGAMGIAPGPLIDGVSWAPGIGRTGEFRIADP